jgi:hypothetical protein
MMTEHRPRRVPKWTRWLKWSVRGLVAAVLLLIVMGWWTMIHMPGKSFSGPLPPADDAITSLAAELRGDVELLAVEIGERNVGRRPEALARAADWLEGEFRKAGYQPQRQTYRVGEVDCANIEAQRPGTAHPEQIVVVGAHYDSVVGTAGANDNGSGVAATLALARRFAGRPTARTLRFVAFVNEEPPYFKTSAMGSRVYARRCRQKKENISAMFSLETIGYYSDRPHSQNYPPPFGMLYPSTGNFIAFVGNVDSGPLVRKAVEIFREKEPFPCEGGALPESIPGIGFSDQWSFWMEGYPALMVTDTALFRYPQYHDAEDTPDKIDFDRMARVVRGVEQVITGVVEP